MTSPVFVQPAPSYTAVRISWSAVILSLLSAVYTKNTLFVSVFMVADKPPSYVALSGALASIVTQDDHEVPFQIAERMSSAETSRLIAITFPALRGISKV